MYIDYNITSLYICWIYRYIYVCIYIYIYIHTHTSCFLISVAQIISRGHGTFLECRGVKSHASEMKSLLHSQSLAQLSWVILVSNPNKQVVRKLSGWTLTYTVYIYICTYIYYNPSSIFCSLINSMLKHCSGSLFFPFVPTNSFMPQGMGTGTGGEGCFFSLGFMSRPLDFFFR